ncbi:amidohydrolase [Micrococcus luteus]|uniref:amidohydrolase n=1 Tax=Micrococcus luteus TaxID=1270 RepID=UPI0021CCC663|nr:amidohydrolase [Micrococcus luteus]MCV7659149.1 amidohydrolase [Micrococcus luteus]MCV7665872.1 amidohydrolase [Micrococcus luteus]
MTTALPGPHAPLDLLIVADTVHTLDEHSSEVTAVGIAGGRIAWLGQAQDADRGGYADVLEIPGGCIVPGLVDAHIHPILGLDFARGHDLSEVTTLDQLRSALMRCDSEVDGWLLGWGLDPSYARDRNPCASDIDAVVSDRPVVIRMFDAHSAVANSKALELAGLTGSEEFASAAEIELDDAGHPTGFLKEWEAMDRVLRHVPPPSFETRLEAFRATLESMADAGLTGGQVLDYTDGMLDLVEAVEKRGELPIRLQFSPWIMPVDGEDRLRQVIDMQGRSGRRWHVDGVKLMIDGTIDNGTAWLASPDVNGESTGPLWLDPEAYTAVLRQLDERGIRTTTHAIGDAGVDYVLDAMEGLTPLAGETPDLPRHRVEHIESVPDATILRFARLGVAASMQPTHCTLYCAGDGSDNWSRRLGPERAGRAWRLGSFRRAGVPLAVGSDWPVAPCDPLRIMADGQLRREAGRPDQTPIVPAEALTALELLEGYTTQRALSWGDREGGRIRIGAPADLTLLGGDPLQTAPDALPEVGVVGTVVDGRLRRVSSGE